MEHTANTYDEEDVKYVDLDIYSGYAYLLKELDQKQEI